MDRFFEQVNQLLKTQHRVTRPLFYRFLPLLVFGFISAFAFYHSLHLFQYKDFYSWTFLFIYLGLGFIIINSSPLRRYLGQADTRWVMPLILVIAAGVRIYFIYSLPTQPIYDYATYHLSATGVSQGNWEALALLEGKPWGYPLLLGLIYKLLGVKVILAQYLNVILSLVSIWLLYLLTRRLVGQSYGLLAAILYALLPSQVFMNNVINSEILFITLVLAGIYFSIRFMQDYSWKNLILTGLFLGLSQVVRPVGMIYLLVFIGFLTLQLFPGHLKRAIKYALVILLSFYVMLVPFLALKSVIYKQPVLWEKGTFGIVFVMGTNTESGGYWNQQDYDYLKSLLIKYDNNAEKVNREAFKLALWRLNRSEDFKFMVPTKIYNMWSIDTFGFEWANIDNQGQLIINEEEPLRTYRGVSQIYYCFLLLLILSSIIGFRMEEDAGYRYIMAIFLAFFVLHIFIEIQGRYHMPLTPLFLVLLAYGWFFRDQGHSDGPNEVPDSL
ncbi:MAG: glycosyltransferase family 39 protein [Syntrophomonadales bacterium]